MLHLITGSNGTGKTLFTLRWVRDRQLKENRPVYYNGRFDINPGTEAEFGWQKLPFDQWQTMPEGGIYICDEAHNDIPPGKPVNALPPHIVALGEHRKHGYDFYLITQHPRNLHGFVTRLLGSPGWHRHLKRLAGGSNVVRVHQWDAVDKDPERVTAKNTAEHWVAKFPKEVFGWYTSAVMHTSKARMPVYVWWLIALIIVFVGFLTHGIYKFRSMASTPQEAPPTLTQAAAPSAGHTVTGTVEPRPMTAAEYAASFVPRINGLQHTAPRYDELTKPQAVPKPAACLEMKGACKCYTQRGTPYPTTADICQQIVKGGLFLDFEPDQVQQPYMPFGQQTQDYQLEAIRHVDYRPLEQPSTKDAQSCANWQRRLKNQTGSLRPDQVQIGNARAMVARYC